MQIIDKIISNFINNKSLYIGEQVTMSEHMIQTAMLAEKAKCNDDLICSCLLHYNSKPTKAVILKSIKIPPVGGDTCFSNMELAWETLDPKIQEKIKNKKAIHSSLGAEFFIDNYKYMEGNEKRNYDSYSNEHPIVRTHPETGKKILYVNWTYTKQIIGLDKEESDQILKEIFEHQARLDLTCRFNWTENAVAIWDNRSVIHYAIADFFPGRGLGYERIMDRIAIEGDHPQ